MIRIVKTEMSIRTIGKWIKVICLLGIMAGLLCGCGENDDTVESFIVDYNQYGTKEAVEEAVQTSELESGNTIYASMHVIESPQGMEYTVNWYLDDNLIASETKETINDREDTMSFSLNQEKLLAGQLRVDVCSQNAVLCTKELTIR